MVAPTTVYRLHTMRVLGTVRPAARFGGRVPRRRDRGGDAGDAGDAAAVPRPPRARGHARLLHPPALHPGGGGGGQVREREKREERRGNNARAVFG